MGFFLIIKKDTLSTVVDPMPSFYCDYCDIYLNFDSYHVRKQHQRGRKHQDNVRQYYMQFLQRSGMFSRSRMRGIPFSSCLVPISRGRGLAPFSHMPFRRGTLTMPQIDVQNQVQQHSDTPLQMQQVNKVSLQKQQTLPINLAHSTQDVNGRLKQRQFLHVPQPFIPQKFA